MSWILLTYTSEIGDLIFSRWGIESLAVLTIENQSLIISAIFKYSNKSFWELTLESVNHLRP